jgi:hypothetical protein
MIVIDYFFGNFWHFCGLCILITYLVSLIAVIFGKD